jgi:ribosomal protein S27E
MTTHRRCSVLVTHFSSNGLDSACGRSSQTLVSTAVTEDVSCKSCQRSLVKPDAGASAKSKAPSLAELRKTAKAAAPTPAEAAVKPAAKVVGTAPAAAKPAKPANVAEQQPARSGGFSVKSAWAARLAEQGDRCRLPRGKGKQRKV